MTQDDRQFGASGFRQYSSLAVRKLFKPPSELIQLQVRILTVVNEKELSGESPAAELSRYLERRGIAAKSDCVDAAGRQISEVFKSYRPTTARRPLLAKKMSY